MRTTAEGIQLCDVNKFNWFIKPSDPWHQATQLFKTLPGFDS